jgi:hypothetical protein
MLVEERTRRYVARRTAEGKPKREIMRCLRATVNRLATFPTWQLSKRFNSRSSVPCYIRYPPIGGAS